MARYRMAMDGTPLPPKGRSKYNAKPVTRGGIAFASKREARRHHELLIMQRIGEISGLELQPEFEFVINEVKVCKYVADFRYQKDGAEVIEDVKSVATAKNRAYRIKHKLMKAVYGIDVLETF